MSAIADLWLIHNVCHVISVSARKGWMWRPNRFQISQPSQKLWKPVSSDYNSVTVLHLMRVNCTRFCGEFLQKRRGIKEIGCASVETMGYSRYCNDSIKRTIWSTNQSVNALVRRPWPLLQCLPATNRDGERSCPMQGWQRWVLVKSLPVHSPEWDVSYHHGV